jgi:hypothetical protein
MNYKKTDLLKNSFNKLIKDYEIKDTLSNPLKDFSFKLDEREFSLTLSQKKSEIGINYNFLIYGEKIKDELNISSVFIIPEENVDEDGTILTTFTNFMEQFGNNLSVGESKRKLFIYEEIPINYYNPNKVISAEVNRNDDFHQNFLFKVKQEKFNFIVQIALAFCINTKKYNEWLIPLQRKIK